MSEDARRQKAKLLRQMSDDERAAFAEKFLKLIKSIIPIDADYFLFMTTEDKNNVIHLSSLGDTEAIQLLKDIEEHLVHMRKYGNKARRGRL